MNDNTQFFDCQLNEKKKKNTVVRSPKFKIWMIKLVNESAHHRIISFMDNSTRIAQLKFVGDHFF